MHGPPDLALIPINRLDDPRVAVYANQRDQWLRARHRPDMTGQPAHLDATPTGLPGDLFIAEGDKVVRQLISSPHETLSVLVGEHRLEHHLPFLEGLPAGVPVFVAGRGTIDEITGFSIHRGLLACGRRRDPGSALEIASKSGLAVVLEDLANHDNVGGVFRCVRALAPPRTGCISPACVLLSPRCCDPLYRKALRVSMGNALHVPFATVEDWPGGLVSIIESGFEPLALTPSADGEDLTEICLEFDRKSMLILGTEGPGLASNTLDMVRRAGGRAVRIEIELEADSLNVAVACALALHRVREWGHGG